MAIQFGIPKRVVNKKEEMYPDTPVVKMLAWEGKGFNKKFEFNQAAVELLELIPGVSSVNFAFDDKEHTAYVGKDDGEGSKLLGKNRSISDKNIYDYITKHYGLDSNVDSYMELTGEVKVGDSVVYRLADITFIQQKEQAPNFVEEEIEHMIKPAHDLSPEFSQFEDGDAQPEEKPKFHPHGDNW